MVYGSKNINGISHKSTRCIMYSQSYINYLDITYFMIHLLWYTNVNTINVIPIILEKRCIKRLAKCKIANMNYTIQ